MKKFDKPFVDAQLKLRDGGSVGGLPGARPSPLSQGPLSREFWGAMTQGVRNTAAPMVKEVKQFNEDYPAVGQVAQLASAPLNVAAGAYGTGKALLENDPAGAAAAALGAIPVLGRFANKGVLAGTQQAVRDFKKMKYMGLSPNAQVVGTTAGRVAPDAGALVQANELGGATYGTTTTLRGKPPGPFYGGN